MPNRQDVEAEEDLNGQLCKYLNLVARHEFPMALFHHEERQTGVRKVDLSAYQAYRLIEGRNYFNLEPFLVLEGKRLPAPTHDREREYVTGNKSISGGIQRFKLGLHGSRLPFVGMIGYIQKESANYWFGRVNEWIDELATSDDEMWSENDRLVNLIIDFQNRTSECGSIHSRRESASPQVRITHFWVEM